VSKAHAEAEADAHCNTIVDSAELAAPGHSQPKTAVAAGISTPPPSELPSEAQLAEIEAHSNSIVHSEADSHVHSAELAAPGHSQPSTAVAAGISTTPPSELPSELQLADVESGERVRT
jgi:hypothetical protein